MDYYCKLIRTTINDAKRRWTESKRGKYRRRTKQKASKHLLNWRQNQRPECYSIFFFLLPLSNVTEILACCCDSSIYTDINDINIHSHTDDSALPRRRCNSLLIKYEMNHENGMWIWEKKYSSRRMKNETEKYERMLSKFEETNWKMQFLFSFFSFLKNKEFQFSIQETAWIWHNKKNPDWLRWRWKGLANRNMFLYSFTVVGCCCFWNTFSKRKKSEKFMQHVSWERGLRWIGDGIMPPIPARCIQTITLWHIVKMFYFDQ